ncbi:GNAT family N-acetyltransferase [Tenggerimyces flavus]|uniref:GNAT family N-acetyltransferase n=1 Tax=Tenggerimyces flavus TaxID=1708749 RepID=A0ABV7YI22_9ACTN|nr:GNAT family N-acetyltransferase [Tenggerimyces flavus]MBM7787562.1 RimJ/RimL family protein N-acetyltransferase [Tenggerimyces flavus]
MRVQTARLLIRDLREDDRESVRQWRHDPDVTRYLDNPTGADADHWFDAALRANATRPRHSHDCAIVLLRSGEVIGWLRIGSSIDTRAGEYVASYALRPEYWNQGYLSEALKAALDVSFSELGALRVYAQAYRANGASTRVMEKAGMRFAGAAPSAAPLLGDSVRYVAERDTRRPGFLTRLGLRGGQRRRVGLVVVLGLVLLLAAPVAVSATLDWLDKPTAPEDARLLRWQPRGELTDDRGTVNEASDAWRAYQGQRPGREIYVVWAGRIAAGRLVLLQSVGPDDVPYLAQVSERGEPAKWVVDRVEQLDEQPLGIVVRYDGNLNMPMTQTGTGASLVQLLLAPPHALRHVGTPRLLRRTRERPNDQPSWEPLVVDDRGMSKTWLHIDRLSPDGTVIAMVWPSSRGRDSVRTIAASPEALLTRQPTIQLADPTWGPMTPFDELVYDDARAAGTVLGPDHVEGDVALLAARTTDTRTSILETRRQGVSTAVLVVWGRNRVECVGDAIYPDLADRSFVAIGCADATLDKTILAVVAKPGTARFQVSDGRGRRVVESAAAQPQVLVIGPGAPTYQPYLVTAYDAKGVAIDRDTIEMNGTLPR